MFVISCGVRYSFSFAREFCPIKFSNRHSSNEAMCIDTPPYFVIFVVSFSSCVVLESIFIFKKNWNFFIGERQFTYVHNILGESNREFLICSKKKNLFKKTENFSWYNFDTKSLHQPSWIKKFETLELKNMSSKERIIVQKNIAFQMAAL